MEKSKTAAPQPSMRFPEFQDIGHWETQPLGKIASIITDRVGNREAVLLSVTSGIGLVTQEEKFGREIAGAQRKNYVAIQKNDFAYNKSATKEFPQGQLAMYEGQHDAGVPNSIFTCFRVDESEVHPKYLSYLFSRNHHGAWLRNFITVGARVNGSLNIDNNDILSMPIPLPTGPKSIREQERIAEFLTSFDDLIDAEVDKLDALKDHKKGLMQQLFPAEGEALPKLRFPKFLGGSVWKEARLSSAVELLSGLHLAPDAYSEHGSVPYFTGPSDFTNDEEYVTKRTDRTTNSASAGDILITVKGSGVGELWYLNLPSVALGRQLMAVRAEGCDRQFLFQFLQTKRVEFVAMASGNLIPGLSRTDILGLKLFVPELPEQEMIGDCLASIDHRIEQQALQIEMLRSHKQGLLQKLLPTLDEVPG